MKKLIQASIPVLSVILLAACGNGNAGGDGKQKDSTVHQGQDHAMEATQTAGAAVQLKDDHLNAVYQHYVHLTTALTNGDMAEAKIAGNAIETGARQVAGAEAFAKQAAAITAAKDIEEQRTAYAALSNAFIALVRKSGLSSGELYVDFCPMAMNDKGASWISAQKEIKNPYFGPKMRTCGEVKETIQ